MGRPRGSLNRPKVVLSESDAFAALAKLTDGPKRDGVVWASKMREKKQKVATDSAKFDAVNAKTTAKANVALVAEAGGLRLPSAGKENQNHHKSHSVISILRAAFTPVSAHAYSVVLGCGHTMP